MSGTMWVEVVFMLVILKIPIVYLCAVVYWAIKSEPQPPEPALVTARLGPDPRPPWRPRRRSRRPRPGPHGSPLHSQARPTRRAGTAP
jgi:hypothetical protein